MVWGGRGEVGWVRLGGVGMREVRLDGVLVGEVGLGVVRMGERG